jgi:phage shock protein A
MREASLTLFGEEVRLEPPFTDLLADVQRRLEALAARYGATLAGDDPQATLDLALDELDAALAGVRDARWRLGRIEIRLVSAVEEAERRLRERLERARAAAAYRPEAP